MTTAFAIATGNQTLNNTKFYSTKELARAKLRDIKLERQHKLGVHVHDDSEDKFSFTIGWEEHFVCFSIVEVNIEE